MMGGRAALVDVLLSAAAPLRPLRRSWCWVGRSLAELHQEELREPLGTAAHAPNELPVIIEPAEIAMIHELYSVTGFEKVAPFVLRVFFDDGAEQIIDFRPVLWGPMFEPLKDPTYFDQVKLDEEIGTLVWPNGADFDPETLRNWPRYVADMAALVADCVAKNDPLES